MQNLIHKRDVEICS